MIKLTYEKNAKLGEVKRPARWVVRQDDNPETDKFFELPKGVKGAYRDMRVLAERFIQEELKLTIPANRVDRYTWTSEPATKTVTAIAEVVKNGSAKVAEVVKDGSKKVGEMLKAARQGNQSLPFGLAARSTNKK